jgi:trk system potassium uptake protein TrkH
MPSLRKNFNPSKTLIQLFVIVIIVGTLALKLPGTTIKPISFIDALFTATSAVCVTGLTVQETGTYFTIYGQIIILLLIQLGALGYMSLASLLVILLRRGMNIKGRLLVQQQMTETKSIKLSRYVLKVAALTFFLEFLGAIILGWRMKGILGDNLKSIYFGIFHSISAFCNAGFDLFTGGVSLIPLRNDYLSVLSIAFLIIIGGIGYFVINDIVELVKSFNNKKRHRISVHTKIVLSTTIVLLLLGTVVFFISEYSNPGTLKGMSFTQKWLMAFFQAVTPRTAGFNMVNTSGLINFSIIFTMVFMFIGASPGGTGGGIKTTTFAVLVANIKSIIQEEPDVFIYKRRITEETIRKTIALFTMGIFLIVLVTLIISAVEKFTIKRILFEVISAFGTVGLSTGITGQLNSVSKVMITLTMFLGRVGPLTVGMALLKKVKKISYRYPEQKVAVG